MEMELDEETKFMLSEILRKLDEGIKNGKIRFGPMVPYENLPKLTKEVLDTVINYFDVNRRSINAEILAGIIDIEVPTAGAYLETLAMDGHLIRIIEKREGRRYYSYRPVIKN